MRTLLSLFLLLVVGCTTKLPELQNLSPVTITVCKNGEPVEGVDVFLHPKEPLGIWGCRGRTNGNGVAVVTTTLREHYAAGARPGTYSVVLIKEPELPSELAPVPVVPMGDISKEAKARQAKRAVFLEKNRIIPAVFTVAKTTPITLVVQKKTPATLTVDVAN